MARLTLALTQCVHTDFYAFTGRVSLHGNMADIQLTRVALRYLRMLEEVDRDHGRCSDPPAVEGCKKEATWYHCLLMCGWFEELSVARYALLLCRSVLCIEPGVYGSILS